MRAAGRWTRAIPEVFSAASLRPDAASADEARADKEAGNALFVREAWRDAIERYDSSVRLDASHASTFTNRAAARFALFTRDGASEELMLALRDAERSLELDPRWVKGHYRAGACLARLCDFAAARDAFLAGAEIDPRNEQIKSALRDVETALEETPRDWEDAKTRGNASYRDGKYEDAVRWYTRGLEFLPIISPHQADENGASSRETTLSVDTTRTTTLSADTLAAAAATLLANRAEARRQMSDVQACVADCDRALMYDPKHVKATVRRALANEYLEKYDRAARDFETASRLDPKNAIAREGSRRVAPFLVA